MMISLTFSLDKKDCSSCFKKKKKKDRFKTAAKKKLKYTQQIRWVIPHQMRTPTPPWSFAIEYMHPFQIQNISHTESNKTSKSWLVKEQKVKIFNYSTIHYSSYSRLYTRDYTTRREQHAVIKPVTLRHMLTGYARNTFKPTFIQWHWSCISNQWCVCVCAS